MQTLKDNIRKGILTAAQKEFAKLGFLKASMRNIAAQAGVGVGNLYNYFPSKDNLFCTVLSPIVSSFYAMFNRHHGEYVDAMEMISEGYLINAVTEYMNLIKGNRTLMRMLLFQSQGSSLEHFKMEFTDKTTELVKVWFENNKMRHPQMTLPDFTSHFFVAFTVKVYTVCVRFLIRFTTSHQLSCFTSQGQRYDFFPFTQTEGREIFPRPRAGEGAFRPPSASLGDVTGASCPRCSDEDVCCCRSRRCRR